MVALPLMVKLKAIPNVAIFSRFGAISPLDTSLNLQATANELKAPSIPSKALAKIEELSVLFEATKDTELNARVTTNEAMDTMKAARLHFSRNFCGKNVLFGAFVSSKYETQCLSLSGCLSSSSSSVNASIVKLLWEDGELLPLSILG